MDMDIDIVAPSGRQMMPQMAESGDIISKIRKLLLEAWRSRYNEVQWGIAVKEVLPNGISGDVYDLAELIVKQSLIGPNPNHQLLRCLIHSLNSKIVSFGAVIEAVSMYDNFNKIDCISSLQELILSFISNISCHGSEEDCLRLCRSIVRLASWTFQVLRSFSIQLIDAKVHFPTQIHLIPGQSSSSIQFLSIVNNQKILKAIERSIRILVTISKSSFLVCLFNVGKSDDLEGREMFMRSMSQFQELDSKNSLLANCFFGLSNLDIVAVTTICNFFKNVFWDETSASRIACEQLRASRMANSTPASHASGALYSLIAFHAILNPVSDIELVASEIHSVSKLFDIEPSDVFCLVIRACFIGLVDAEERKNLTNSNTSGEEQRWAAFTFLKMPKIMSKVSEMVNSSELDIELALDKLLTFTPLLDLTDIKSNCDCVQLLLNELRKNELIGDVTRSKMAAKRTSSVSNTSPQAGCNLILKAEPTVNSILRTMLDDMTPDVLLHKILCPMIRSFELILNTATATGRLDNFATKLLIYNESYKQSSTAAETNKAATNRALLFDVSFLFLCHIAQSYGVDMIIKNSKNKNSFFASWAKICLPQKEQFCDPEVILEQSCNQDQVDDLLNLFSSKLEPFKTSSVKWNDVCLNLPAVIREVVIAYEQDSLDWDSVKLILDKIKTNMCCLSVIASIWLSSLVTTLPEDQRQKPLQMIQHLVSVLPESSLPAKSESSDEISSLQMHLKERSQVMTGIIERMILDLNQNVTMAKNHLINHKITSGSPLNDLLETSFSSSHSRLWLDLKCVHEMETLLKISGSDTFVDLLIRQLLKMDTSEELLKASSLIFGLFHLDLKHCSISLLDKVLPAYLLYQNRLESLREPKASALARLVVITILATSNSMNDKDNSGLIPISKSKSSSHIKHESGQEDIDVDIVIKKDPDARKVSSNAYKPFLMSVFETTPHSFQRQQKSSSSKTPPPVLKNAFNRSVANLILLLHSIVEDAGISQRTNFPLIFLEQLILCGKQDSQLVTQFIPLDMIMSLIRTNPESMTFELLMTLCDLSTLKSRKATARSLCQLLRARKMAKLTTL